MSNKHELDKVLLHWGVKGMKWDEDKKKKEEELKKKKNKAKKSVESFKKIIKSKNLSSKQAKQLKARVDQLRSKAGKGVNKVTKPITKKVNAVKNDFNGTTYKKKYNKEVSKAAKVAAKNGGKVPEGYKWNLPKKSKLLKGKEKVLDTAKDIKKGVAVGVVKPIKDIQKKGNEIVTNVKVNREARERIRLGNIELQKAMDAAKRGEKYVPKMPPKSKAYIKKEQEVLKKYAKQVAKEKAKGLKRVEKFKAVKKQGLADARLKGKLGAADKSMSNLTKAERAVRKQDLAEAAKRKSQNNERIAKQQDSRDAKLRKERTKKRQGRKMSNAINDAIKKSNDEFTKKHPIKAAIQKKLMKGEDKINKLLGKSEPKRKWKAYSFDELDKIGGMKRSKKLESKVKNASNPQTKALAKKIVKGANGTGNPKFDIANPKHRKEVVKVAKEAFEDNFGTKQERKQLVDQMLGRDPKSRAKNAAEAIKKGEVRKAAEELNIVDTKGEKITKAIKNGDFRKVGEELNLVDTKAEKIKKKFRKKVDSFLGN